MDKTFRYVSIPLYKNFEINCKPMILSKNESHKVERIDSWVVYVAISNDAIKFYGMICHPLLIAKVIS